MFKKIDHVELIPLDFERSVRFYTDVIGFKLTRRVKPKDSIWDEIVFVELGGSQIEILSAKNPVPSDGLVRVGLPRLCLLADDLEGTLALLKTKGIDAVGPIHNIDGPNGTRVKLAEIKDPDGLSIELIERKQTC